MMNSPRQLLLLIALTVVALGGFSSRALAEDRTYSFVNSSNHEVTVSFTYPAGSIPGPGAITQMKLKPGVTWNYSINSSLPNLRVDLNGGSWKDYKGMALFIGANSGAATPGTYAIK